MVPEVSQNVKTSSATGLVGLLADGFDPPPLGVAPTEAFAPGSPEATISSNGKSATPRISAIVLSASVGSPTSLAAIAVRSAAHRGEMSQSRRSRVHAQQSTAVAFVSLRICTRLSSPNVEYKGTVAPPIETTPC